MSILEVHSQLNPVGEKPWVAKQDSKRNHRDNDSDKARSAHTVASAGESYRILGFDGTAVVTSRL